MQKEDRTGDSDKACAAVCGLYCGACSWYISTTEDRERLQQLADRAHLTEEEATCLGCRSGERLPYCEHCRIGACAAERGVDFCSDCEEYPCGELIWFQSAMPHRIELWDNLERIKAVGYEKWLAEIREHYTCPECRTINSPYDIQCRNCGKDPSCEYVAEHRRAIERYLNRRR